VKNLPGNSLRVTNRLIAYIVSISEIILSLLASKLVALGGVSLLVRVSRSLGRPAAIQERVQAEQRERRYDEAT
jgi:hypothetical protein